MCASSKPKISRSSSSTQVLKVTPPEETATVSTGADSDKARKGKKKTALGTRQLTISLDSGVNAGNGSGINT